jgi:hypothetical protein
LLGSKPEGGIGDRFDKAMDVIAGVVKKKLFG